MAQQSITLQTSDSDVVSGDVLGRINFAASNESSGSEAKWIGASVYAEASGEFTASVNPTNLVFATSDADGIVARHRVTNVGHFVPLLNTTYNLGASNLKYNNIFAATGTLDRVVATGIQLTGSASQSGLLYINNSNLISSSPNVLFSNADLASPKLIFKASGTTTPDLSLNILTTASGTTSGVQTLSIQGSAGELFSITDVLDSGTIFSVNDISGLSLIEADASGVVTLVRYGTNVAVGDFVPTQKLHVGGNLRVSGAYYDSLNSPGTSGHILVSTSGGTSWRSLNQLTGVDGSGTAGYVARWTDTDTIGSGLIFDNGTNIGIGTASPAQKLSVFGGSVIINKTTADADKIFIGSNLADAGANDRLQISPSKIKTNANTSSFTITGDNLDYSSITLYSRGNATNSGQIILQAMDANNVQLITYLTPTGLGIGQATPTARLHVQAGSATATGVIVRGAASQSADLLQIQNSAGTTLLDIDAAGSLSGIGSGIFMQRLGVGTSSPAYKVDILTSGSNDGLRARTVNNIDFATLRNSNSDSFPIGALILNYGNDPSAYIEGRSNSLFLRGGWTNGGTITFNPTTVGSTTAEIMRINQTGVGIFTTSPTQALHVSGNIRLAGALFDSLNLPGASGQVLVSTSGGVEWRTSSGGIDGTGSANYLARWIDADTLGTGIVYDNGTNVGIGTASPSTRLHIRRTSGDFIRLGVNDANANGVGGNIEWYTNEAVSADYLGGLRMQFSGGTGNVNRQMQFLVGDVITPKAVINGTGNMGIGTTSPAVKLDVVGDFAVQKTDGGYFVNNYFNGDTPVFGYYGATGLIFATVTTRTGGGYTERVRFDNNGNVGIGTASPTQKLDVRGNTYVSGVLTVSSGNFGESIVFHNGYKIRSFGGGGLEILSNPYTRIGNTGGAQVANFTAGTNIGAGLNITPIASQTGLVITGAASQTADLFQAQNSAGTALVRVDAAGSISGVASGIFMQRVGIGTSNPSYPLDVNGNAYIAGSILLGGYAYYGARFGTYLWTNADTTVQTQSGYSTLFNVGATEIARITSSGLGIGTTSPTRALDVRGSAFISGALYDSTNSAGTNGQVLTSTATGTDWKSLSEIVGVDGVGTSGYVARWIDGDTIGTGVIYDNGTNVGVRTTAPSTTLDVRGTGYFSESIRTSGTVVFASGNTGTVGVMQWNDGEGGVDLGLKGGNVTVNIGQDNVVLCYNGTGSSLSKGQVVYASGAQGQRPSVNLALATSDLSSARTIGLVDETIGIGAEGFVATFGVITNLNTSALTAGSGLWLSATTPGAITMTRPVAPNHGVFIGWCLNSHASAGRIFVNVQNGVELDEVHDVLIQNVASGDVLQYDSSNLTWRNRTRSQAGLVEGVGTSGYAARWISANVIGTGVVYDNGTNVGIGTTSPTAKLHIETGSAATSGILVRGAFAQTADYLRVQDSSSGNVMRLSNNAEFILGANSGVAINAGLIKIGEDPNASAGGKFFIIYNTFSNINSYERLNIGWRAAPYDTNVAYISTENSLGGTIRDIAITHDDYTAVGADTMRFKAATQFVGVSNESPTARFHVNTNSATVTGVIVQGAASQTADLFQAQNSAGTTLLDIDAAGSLSGVGSGIFMQRVGVGTSTPDGALDVVTDTNGSFYFGNKDDAFKVNTIVFRQATHSSEPEGYAALCNTSISNSSNSLSIGGGSTDHNAFTSINLMTASDSSVRQGTTRLRIISNGNVGIATATPVYPLDVRGSGYFSNGVVTSGRIGINITETTPTAMLDVRSNSATVTGVIVRGAAAQTADLQQWQNSAGTALVRVDAAGSVSGVASGLFNYIGLNNPTKSATRFDILETGVKNNVSSIFLIRDASTVSNAAGNSIGYSYIPQALNHNYSGIFTGFRYDNVANCSGQIGLSSNLGYSRYGYGTYTTIENVAATGYGSYVGFLNDANAATLSKAVGYVMNWIGDNGAYSNNPNIIGVELNIDDSINEYANIYGFKADITFGNGSVAYGFYITGAEASYLSHSLGLGRTIPSAKLDLVTNSNNEIGIITRASSAAQTADLQQWLNSASGVLLRVDAAGSVSGVASGIFDQNLRVANIPAGSSETDVVLVKTDGTFVKRPSSSLGVGGGSGISNEDSIINALIFG